MKNVGKSVENKEGYEYPGHQESHQLDQAFGRQGHDHPLVTFGGIETPYAEYDGKGDHEKDGDRPYVLPNPIGAPPCITRIAAAGSRNHEER